MFRMRHILHNGFMNSVVALAILGPLAFAASGCSQQSWTALPEGVTIDVYQNRIDYAEHKLEVAIANATDKPFTVLSLSFASPAFSPAAVYRKAPTTVRSGTTTDFRLVLPQSQCDAPSSTPTVDISFSYQGATGSASLSPKDRLNQLASMTVEDCQDAAVAAVATLTPARSLRFTTVNGQRAAVLDFEITPTGSKNEVLIVSARGTVLVGAWDSATNKSGNTIPLAINLRDLTTPITMSLTLLPARCDPHVVLEDKRGTFFTFMVTTKRGTGPIFIGVSDELRAQIYDFVGDSCGWN